MSASILIVPSVTKVPVSGKMVATRGSKTVPPDRYSDGPMHLNGMACPLAQQRFALLLVPEPSILKRKAGPSSRDGLKRLSH